jgi:hypothetical protein
MKETTILCALEKSIYKTILGCDVWDKNRDAYLYTGSNIVIVHPPCQQWSRLKAFANDDKKERELAMFCLEKVKSNGGIFEHPAGSSFFKYAGIKPTISINQSWFGFPAQKKTFLYFHDCEPLQLPLSFDAIEKTVPQLSQKFRSYTTIDLAKWLINSAHNK